MPLIDTHSVIKEFIAAGINEQQAELITKTINQSNNNLVTKTDLKLGLAEVKSELKAEIQEVRSEIQEVKSELHHNLNWIRAIGFLILGMLAKLTFFS